MEDFMVVYVMDGHRKVELFQYLENVCQYCKRLRDFNRPYKVYQFTKAGSPHFKGCWTPEN